jgi:hypothetical protein
MTISLTLLNEIHHQHQKLAWQALLDYAWQVCSAPLNVAKVVQQITERERLIASVDLLLASTCWDLWHGFETSVESTADVLAHWWQHQPNGKAVLILDGLSLREVPWILQGAAEQGLTVRQARATCSELPSKTTPFAKALGFNKRADLQNDGASQTHRLPGAKTDCVNLPWFDCISLITPQPNWVLWHEWPDTDLHHQFAQAGQGAMKLAETAAAKLKDTDFWELVKRLMNGRKLVITSDHGYGATGTFPDAIAEQNQYLKAIFGQERCSSDVGEQGVWVPPIDLVLDSRHGRHRYALGRRKWKCQGGYPTLTHGGLSLLEVAVPFIELSQGSGG